MDDWGRSKSWKMAKRRVSPTWTRTGQEKEARRRLRFGRGDHCCRGYAHPLFLAWMRSATQGDLSKDNGWMRMVCERRWVLMGGCTPMSALCELYFLAFTRCTMSASPLPSRLFFCSCQQQRKKQASQRGRKKPLSLKLDSTRLSTGQAEDLPDQFSEWGIGEWVPRLSPHFMRKGRYRYFLQVPTYLLLHLCLPLPCFALPWPQSCLPRAGPPCSLPRALLYSTLTPCPHAQSYACAGIHLGPSATHLCPTRGKSLRFSPF